ncbi:polymorphic toxin type 28 domain-containing protein [Amycolatopsis cynarae]|uniref:Polymorphic toxin type 28 domain-containing protein n=1 Tax=Amycolatopsis cynarae TaxID=2995223 RepID=A0ABY7B452_9PSEU|nr:polymorphic toxin type 28 domain-containing protein [Amycolatopsis sp. HUAS 11-8]WAL66710.1 polymorphic toxin type 28 domain-containing protein [Amycolatopsis sp. HUAS 11-8]
MVAELGETQDSRQLVLGQPEAIDENVRVLRARGDRANQAGEGLLAIDTGAWEGPAAHAFQDKFSYEPGKWFDAADALSGAAEVLARYADTLRWAQSQAIEAVDLWNQGQAASQQARAAHDIAVAQASANNQPAPPFSDPGESSRQAAKDILNRARSQLNEAGDSIAGFLRDYAAAAPQKSSWLEDVGDFLSDVGTHIVNDVASFGNVLLQHPGDVVSALGGLGLTVVSSAGMAGGAALTATGEGAVIGVPAMSVSAVGAVEGTGMMAAAIGDLAAHAGGDDRVEVVKPRHEPSTPTKTDRLKEHLTDKDLEGARRELNGEVVKEKSSGVPYDHIDEVQNAQRGLVKQINRLKQQLSDSRLAPENRPALEAELSEASRLLDYSEQFVPRG